MKLKTTFTILESNFRVLVKAKNEFPTLVDLMREQNISTKHDNNWKKECELNQSH